MKKIADIFELLDNVLPSDARRTVVFCEVEENAYEIFYYSYFSDDSCKQCYELEAEGKITSKTLENGFEKLASFIRDSSEYDPEKRNVITLLVNGSIEKSKIEQFDKNVSLYKIKKEWKSNNLQSL